MESITIVTLVSGKSKRFPNKNLYEVNGIPLLKYTTDFVKELQKKYKLSRYYIITDDEKIKGFCIKEKINYLIEPKHNEERTPERCQKLMQWIDEQIRSDYYIMLPATSPIRDRIFINKIKKDCEKNKYESATTVYKTNRNNYRHNGSFWWFHYSMFYKEDLIDNNTRLFIDGFSFDIDTKKDIKKFEEYICKQK